MTVTFALNFIANSSGVDWTRTLIIAWLVVALSLSVIEVLLLTGHFGEKTSQVAANADARIYKRGRHDPRGWSARSLGAPPRQSW